MQFKRTVLAALIAVAGVTAFAQDVLTGSFRISDTTVKVLGPATAYVALN